MISSSLDCRYLNGLKEEREAAVKIFKEAGVPEVDLLCSNYANLGETKIDMPLCHGADLLCPAT